MSGCFAQACEHELLPHCRSSAAGGFSCMQTVSTGCFSGFAAVEYASRCRGPCHATDRRRGRRPRRGVGVGNKTGLQHSADRAVVAGRGGCRAVGFGPCTTCANGSNSDRDNIVADGASGVCCGICQHTDVQRNGIGGVCVAAFAASGTRQRECRGARRGHVAATFAVSATAVSKQSVRAFGGHGGSRCRGMAWWRVPPDDAFAAWSRGRLATSAK